MRKLFLVTISITLLAACGASTKMPKTSAGTSTAEACPGNECLGAHTPPAVSATSTPGVGCDTTVCGG